MTAAALRKTSHRHSIACHVQMPRLGPKPQTELQMAAANESAHRCEASTRKVSDLVRSHWGAHKRPWLLGRREALSRCDHDHVPPCPRQHRHADSGQTARTSMRKTCHAEPYPRMCFISSDALSCASESWLFEYGQANGAGCPSRTALSDHHPGRHSELPGNESDM